MEKLCFQTETQTSFIICHWSRILDFRWVKILSRIIEEYKPHQWSCRKKCKHINITNGTSFIDTDILEQCGKYWHHIALDKLLY